jgi:hypothetical protein
VRFASPVTGAELVTEIDVTDVPAVRSGRRCRKQHPACGQGSSAPQGRLMRNTLMSAIPDRGPTEVGLSCKSVVDSCADYYITNFDKIALLLSYFLSDRVGPNVSHPAIVRRRQGG